MHTDTAPAAPAVDDTTMPIELVLDLLGDELTGDADEQPGVQVMSSYVRRTSVEAVRAAVEATAEKIRKRVPGLQVTVVAHDHTVTHDGEVVDPLFCLVHRMFGCTSMPWEDRCRKVATPASIVQVWAEGLPMFDGGWHVVGVLTRDAAGVVARHAVAERYEALVAGHVDLMGQCVHCGRTRARNTTILVADETETEVRPIGKSCAAEYTGNALRPDALATLTALGDRFAQASGVAAAAEPMVAPTVDVVAMSIVAGRRWGFVPASRADVKNPATSWRIIEGMVWNGEGKAPELLPEHVTDADRAAAAEAIAVILDRSADTDADATNGYLSNLRAAAESEWAQVEGRLNKVGLLASLPGAFERRAEALARRAEREAERAAQAAQQVNAWIGQERDRRPFTGTVVRRVAFETMYGWMDLLVVDTAEGQIIGKGTIGSADLYERGDRISLTATIKVHVMDTYGGREMRQTQVNRVKITSIAPVRSGA